MRPVPEIRIRDANRTAVRPDGRYVVYWMIAQRRVRSNFALQHAANEAKRLGKPLLVFEPLRAGYRWASQRLHAFVIDGMVDNAARLDRADVRYFPYLEPEPGAGKGLLAALAEEACLIVTDEFPCFFLPSMVEAAARQVTVRLQSVDGNGILPLRATDHAHPTAYAFRRTLQKKLRDHLDDFPVGDPLKSLSNLGRATIPRAVLDRWSPVPAAVLKGDDDATSALLADLPIDPSVMRTSIRGGARAGERCVKTFFERKLERYADERNEPQEDVASGLSPYLHFGHVSVHDVVRQLFLLEEWDEDRLGTNAQGKRAGWWGLSAPSEAFLDELITWREVGYGFCFHRPDDYDRFESLPDWALETLAEHEEDPREWCYSLRQFERAETHDDLWNAAQMQLVTEGRIHNYLRMLWGKKIFEWSASPRLALEHLIELNNKYALDGRNPNSYSGIFWTLGRFDRAWGPERPIFGKVRYMTSANTARKVRVKEYIARYRDFSEPDLFRGA